MNDTLINRIWIWRDDDWLIELRYRFTSQSDTKSVILEMLFLARLLTSTENKYQNQEKQPQKKKCGPMPNVMVALPNIGGALCSTPQSLADAHY